MEESTFYRRGSGLRIWICRLDEERVEFYRRENERLGNPVFEHNGWLCTTVLRYDPCFKK
jgi:hypothetical protein